MSRWRTEHPRVGGLSPSPGIISIVLVDLFYLFTSGRLYRFNRKLDFMNPDLAVHPTNKAVPIPNGLFIALLLMTI